MSGLTCRKRGSNNLGFEASEASFVEGIQMNRFELIIYLLLMDAPPLRLITIDAERFVRPNKSFPLFKVH